MVYAGELYWALCYWHSDDGAPKPPSYVNCLGATAPGKDPDLLLVAH